MKKFTFAALAAVSAVMMYACGNGTPKANLKSDVDTVSYAIGMAQYRYGSDSGSEGLSRWSSWC